MENAELPLEAHGRPGQVYRNEIFRQLVTEHHVLDEQVRQLATLPHPTEQEQLEEIALKKRKLVLKDRIEAIARGRP